MRLAIARATRLWDFELTPTVDERFRDVDRLLAKL